MGINNLRYFAVVAQTKNLRKAAQIVGITPGSMSKAISALESELAIKLLRSEGRGIDLTDDGVTVYNSLIPLLEEYSRFQNSITQKENLKTQKIKIATFEVFSSYFMSNFIFSTMPDSQFLLYELGPSKIEMAVLNGSVDFGITYAPSVDQKLDFTEIGQFKMGIWGLKKWSKLPFSSWPFAVPTSSLNVYTIKEHSLDLWPKSTPERLVQFEFELLETSLQTSRLGLSVIHCPDFVIKLHNDQVQKEKQLVELPYPASTKKSKPITIYLVSKKGNPKLKLFEGKMAKFIRSIK